MAWSFIPDMNEIGEKQNEEQMGRLLQLVLGIGIHCDGKEGLILYLVFLDMCPMPACLVGYIQTIRSMEESVQHVVMEAIQHLMQNYTPETPITSSRELEELQEEVAMCIVNLPLSRHFVYRIVLNFGGAKLWRIWRIAFLSPNITLQNSPNCAQ